MFQIIYSNDDNKNGIISVLHNESSKNLAAQNTLRFKNEKLELTFSYKTPLNLSL